jgi:hypothetical protein
VLFVVLSINRYPKPQIYFLTCNAKVMGLGMKEWQPTTWISWTSWTSWTSWNRFAGCLLPPDDIAFFPPPSLQHFYIMESRGSRQRDSRSGTQQETYPYTFCDRRRTHPRPSNFDNQRDVERPADEDRTKHRRAALERARYWR